MLLTLQGETLIARAWKQAVEVFGRGNVIVAIPHTDDDGPLGEELRRIDADVFAWDGQERDVLARFYHCAHEYRWHPASIIVRWTPDDVKKSSQLCREVSEGARHPVWMSCEAFTLAQLDTAHRNEPAWRKLPTIGLRISPDLFVPDSEGVRNRNREHISYALFPTYREETPPLGACIDTPADYDAAVALVGR